MIHVLLCLSLLLWPQPTVNVNFGCKSRKWATFVYLASNRSLWCLCISFLYTVGSFSRQQTNAHSFPMDFVWHMFWWLCGFFLDPLKQPTRQLSEGLSSIHPGRFTWNLKMMLWKMTFLFQGARILRFYANLRGCNLDVTWAWFTIPQKNQPDFFATKSETQVYLQPSVQTPPWQIAQRFPWVKLDPLKPNLQSCVCVDMATRSEGLRGKTLWLYCLSTMGTQNLHF